MRAGQPRRAGARMVAAHLEVERWGRKLHPFVAAIPSHKEPPISAHFEKHFLIVDSRFGTPIHIFLEMDPTAEPGFPGFEVCPVTLEWPAEPPGLGVPAGVAIGRNPHRLDNFRTFRSNQAVAGAGFILIEPRYVGPNWPAYVLAFRAFLVGSERGTRTSWGNAQGMNSTKHVVLLTSNIFGRGFDSRRCLGNGAQ
jgi:hypothetical protein